MCQRRRGKALAFAEASSCRHAANGCRGLADEDLHAGFRQVAGADEAVVARADHDGVVSLSHR